MKRHVNAGILKRLCKATLDRMPRMFSTTQT